MFGPQNQTDSGTGKSTLGNELNTNLNSIIKKTGLITVDGVASTPDQSGLDRLIDKLFITVPSSEPLHNYALANALKIMIALRPDQKQAMVDELAMRYWKEADRDPRHRPLMAELIRNAGLSDDVGAALDKLAAQNPQDAALNAQHDAGGNQTTLSAGDQVRGISLPSIFPDREAFDAALGVLNPYLNSPANSPDHHGNFSIETVKTLSQMPLDDPRWADNSIFGEPVDVEQRQTIKDAATTVLLPKNAAALSEIVGADGIFKDDNVKAWRANYANHAKQADGKIDSFSQGGIGDCFLLSVVNAVAKTPEGRQQIRNSISKNESNGTYSIQLAGDPNKTVFTVTQAEIDAAHAKGTSSSGDADMIAFELGIEKYKQLHGATIADGGIPADIIKLITGREGITTSSAESSMKSIVDAEADGDGFAMTLACGVTLDGKPVAFGDSASVGGHAFAVTSIDKTTQIATVENPWDTSKPYKISVKDLASFGYLDYLPPPDGATAAATAKTDAQESAKSAAKWDAEAHAQAAIAAGPNVSGDRSLAAAAAAHVAAVKAAEASDKAQRAAAVPGAGPEAAAAAKAAAASAASAKSADAAAKAASKKAALEDENARS